MFKSRVAAVSAGALLLGAILTGGAVASDMIGTFDIKNNSVRSKDIHDGTVNLKDIRDTAEAKLRGQRGPAGPAGAKGDTGARGPAGQDGADAGKSAAGAGYTTTWPGDNGAAVHETVETCAEGEYVTGGGFSTFGGAGLTPTKDLGGDNKNIQITVSAPYVESDGAYVPISDADSRFYADRWVVRGYNNSATEQVVRAWALCAPIPAN